MATSFFNNNCADDAEEIESAKNYADLARDWAIKLDGLVDGIDFSSKYWALQSAEGAGLSVTIKEDGTPLGDSFTVLNFGAGVSATQTTTNEVLIQSTGQVLVETFDDGVGFIAGTSDEITLATEVVSKNNIDIYFDGVYQNKETYDVSGILVTFDSIIPVGVGEIEVVYPRLMDIGVTSADNVTFDGSTVDAELVSLDGRLTIVERSTLVNRPFPNVAAVDTATFLQTGDFVEWLGYTTPGDGGGNKGEIGTGFGPADNGSVFDLSGSGLQARGLFLYRQVTISQFGATSSESSANIQAAIDYQGTDNLVFDVNSTINTAIVLRSNLNLIINPGVTLTWSGGATGPVITSSQASVLVNSGIFCNGGTIDLDIATSGIELHSHQLCTFNIELDGSSNSCIAVSLVGDSTTASGSNFGTSQISSNSYDRIVHIGTCGKLIYIEGQNNPTGGIFTLNVIGFLRAAFCTIIGIDINGWADTNEILGPVNIRLNANNSRAISFGDDATVYEWNVGSVSVGAYGVFTGRSGVYIGNNTRHITVSKLFIDGNLDTEAGNVVASATAQSYKVSVHYLGGDGVRFQDVCKNYLSRATTVSSEFDQVVMADDSAVSFPLRREQAVIITNSGSGNAAGVVWVKPKSTGAATKKLAGDATFYEVTTGILTGTTGADNRFTVSAATDGNIYFENRLGSEIQVIFFSAAGFNEI